MAVRAGNLFALDGLGNIMNRTTKSAIYVMELTVMG